MAEATLSDIKQQLVESVEEQQDTNDEIRNLNRKFGLWMKNQDRRLDRERLANLEMLREMKKLASNRPIAAGAGGLFSGVSASTGIFADLISGALGAALGASLLPLLKRMARNLLKLTGIPLAIKSIKSFFGIGKDGPGFFTRIVDSFKSTFDDLIERIKKAVSGIFDFKLGGRLGTILAGIYAIGTFFKIPNMPKLDRGPRATPTGSLTDTRLMPRVVGRPTTPTGSLTDTRLMPRVVGRPPTPIGDLTNARRITPKDAKAELDKIPAGKYSLLKELLNRILGGVSAALFAYDVYLIAKILNSEMSDDDKTVAIGGILGRMTGEVVLGAIGGLIGAGVWSFVSGTLGMIAGGFIGQELGEALAEYLVLLKSQKLRDLENNNNIVPPINLNHPPDPGKIFNNDTLNITLLKDLGQVRSLGSEQGNGVRIVTNENDWYKLIPTGSNRLPGPTTPMSLFTPPSYTGESGAENMRRNNPVAASASMEIDNGKGVPRIPDWMRYKNLPPEEVAKKRYPALKRLFIFLTFLGVASLIPQIVNAANENVSDQQKIENIAKILGPEISGIIIALLMGNMAAALGTATGPAAPIVSTVLGVVGGAVGYYIGSNLGEQASIKLAAWALGLMKLPELVEWARHSLTAMSQSARATNLGRSVGTMMEMGAAYLGVDKKDFVNRFKVGMAAANASLKSGKGIVPAALGLGVGFLTGRAPTNIEENPYVVNEILRNSRHFLRDGAIAGYPGAGLPSVEIARIQNNRGRELYAKSAEVFDMTRAPVALAYTPVVNAPSTSVQNNQSNFISSGFVPSFDMTYMTYSPQ